MYRAKAVDAVKGDYIGYVAYANGGEPCSLQVLAASEKALQVQDSRIQQPVWIPRSALMLNTRFNEIAATRHGVKNVNEHFIATWFKAKATLYQKKALGLIATR